MVSTKNPRENPQADAPASATIDATDERGGSILGHIWASIGATLVLGAICCGFFPLVVWAVSQSVFPIQANGSLVKKDGTPTIDDKQAVGSTLIGQNFSAPGYFHPRPSAAGSGYDAANSGGTNLGPLSDKLINGALKDAPPPGPASTPTGTAAGAPAAPLGAAAVTPPAKVVDFDGIRLRMIHYCVENEIAFKLYRVKADGTRIGEVPLSKYQDKDGNLLDMKLVDDFPHPPTDSADKVSVIAADFATLVPGDAVTGSGSGLDPHISPENAALQAPRVAAARKLPKDTVLRLIKQNTDEPNLGFLGDPGVNVLMLNIALDKVAPPATILGGAPATAPATK